MHRHLVHIYYEDTDLSGVVYHANYLKYFELAREHMLGRAELVRLLDEDGVGFVVYKASLSFRKGARLGDELEIRTVARRESDWRAIFEHSVWKEGEKSALVEGVVEMVCVDQQQKLVPLPESVDLSAYATTS